LDNAGLKVIRYRGRAAAGFTRSMIQVGMARGRPGQVKISGRVHAASVFAKESFLRAASAAQPRLDFGAVGGRTVGRALIGAPALTPQEKSELVAFFRFL
jgi:hypothetical protein